VTFIVSPLRAIFKYFNKLALSSVMVTSITAVDLTRLCTTIMYNRSQLSITMQIQSAPSVATKSPLLTARLICGVSRQAENYLYRMMQC
jgi:hypothetical protein